MSSQTLLTRLAQYHPVVIEGMGSYDQRDPTVVVSQIIEQLRQHWRHKPPSKPLLILTQGDPIEATGIAAITFGVAESLQLSRGLVCLDEHIAAYHARDADRRRVIVELWYSQLAEQLEAYHPGIISQIESAIDHQLKTKNACLTHWR